MTAIERFIYWIRERESIRLKRLAGYPKPWTDDPILQSYRFCNVRRMDDKVSDWLLQNWYQPYFNHKNMILAIALARFFNKPESLREIGFPTKYRPDHIKEVLRRLKEKETIFNGAYMVRGNDGVDKISSVIDFYIQPLVDNPPSIDSTSMETSHRSLLGYYGWGSFMAGQVIADARWAIQGEWYDKHTWAPIGPGSKRGINRFYGRLPSAALPDSFITELTMLIDICEAKLPESITSRLEAMDYQNCCCEFDKYERVLHSQGKPKQKYPGAA